MSWNFEIDTKDGERDAERVFNNAVHDNGAHIDFATQAKVRAMAKSAIYNAPRDAGREQGIKVHTHGHVDKTTGFGNFTVSVEFYPVAEAVPNTPPELQPGPAAEGDAQDVPEVGLADVAPVEGKIDTSAPRFIDTLPPGAVNGPRIEPTMFPEKTGVDIEPDDGSVQSS
jgi:hypothetical protein